MRVLSYLRCLTVCGVWKSRHSRSLSQCRFKILSAQVNALIMVCASTEFASAIQGMMELLVNVLVVATAAGTEGVAKQMERVNAQSFSTPQ